MAELTRLHPLDQFSATLAGRSDPSLVLAPEPFVAMVDLRLPAPASDDTVLGAPLPVTPNTWVAAGWGRAVWLAPDEWLLTSTGHAPDELEQRVRESVPPGAAVVDVSAQRIGVRVSGRRARDVLAKGCSVDLHPRVFVRGRAAQTTVGLAGVILLALSDLGDDFLLLVRSSFAGYLADWLLDAAEEFSEPATDPTSTQE